MALEPSFARVERSVAQAKTLEGEVKAFTKSVPYEVTVQVDGHGPKDVAMVLRAQPTALMWSVQMGEILHNLRAALDNAVWEMILLNGGVPNPSTSGFPIKRSAGTWRQSGLRMVSGLNEAAVALIESAQPLHLTSVGGTPTQHPLWVLQELSNIDKHRLLHTTTMATELKNFRVIAQEADVEVESVTVNKGWTLDQETEVGRVRLSAASRGALLVLFDGTARIAFNEAPTARLDVTGQSVTQVIAQVGNEVIQVLTRLRRLI